MHREIVVRCEEWDDLTLNWKIKVKNRLMEEQLFPHEQTSQHWTSGDSVRNEIKKLIVGQDEMVKLIIAAYWPTDTFLLKASPASQKLTAKLVARSLNVVFHEFKLSPWFKHRCHWHLLFKSETRSWSCEKQHSVNLAKSLAV